MATLIAKLRSSISAGSARVVISDTNEPGEGEFKIINLANNIGNSKMLIVSPDADMVLQAMLIANKHHHV